MPRLGAGFVLTIIGIVCWGSLIMTLVGCSMIESDAGKAHYKMSPVVVDGVAICCEVDIFNAKDVGKIKATATKLDDGSYEITLEEEGVNSSAPMGMMMQQQNMLMETLLKTIPLR